MQNLLNMIGGGKSRQPANKLRYQDKEENFSALKKCESL